MVFEQCRPWECSKAAGKGKPHYFGHEQADTYYSLIHDNRGMGESDKSFAHYSTSETAKGILDVLDTSGWTAELRLHVVCTGMGGMVAQEPAFLEPKHMAFTKPSQHGCANGQHEVLRRELARKFVHVHATRGLIEEISVVRSAIFC